MARLIVELTNRCNLRCAHCFDERHAAVADLPFEIIRKLVSEGRGCGIDELCFTGGEPTVHREFESIVQTVAGAGYAYSFVSNATNFRKVHALLLRYREPFRGVTFSLDGACETTHDRIRGEGSFRRVMQAAALCLFSGLPFTFNMVLTAWNRHEIGELVALAETLGSDGVRFGHLMFTPETAVRGLDLSPAERRALEREIGALRRTAHVAVGMAPGYFVESPAFRCAPLSEDEYNVDYRGNLTLCCQLSGIAGPNSDSDSLGNLNDIGLKEALENFRLKVATYLQHKASRLAAGRFTALDHFPCFYCVKYFGKAAWLMRSTKHAWAELPDPIDSEGLDANP